MDLKMSKKDGCRIEGFFLFYFIFFNQLAEREGFEHSMFICISMGYKAIVSRSRLTEAEKCSNSQFGWVA
jgi:hypothetical protein